MSTWVSAAPVIGASSLDGFAVGALMTGACALAVTAPRRTRGRKARSARDRGLAAEEAGWLCEHVMAAETVGAEVPAEAAVAGGPPAFAAAPVLTSGETPPVLASGETPPVLAAGETPPGPTLVTMPPGLTSVAMSPALTSGTVVPEFVAAAAVPGLAAEAVASALTAATVGPAQTADLTPTPAAGAPAPGAEAFEIRAERLAPPEQSAARARRRGAAKGADSYRSRHRLGDPVPGSMPWDGAELVFPDPPRDPDPSASDRALGSPRPAEARRMPRHAAPSVGFGSRITGFSSRITGLFAPRALATGARG
jgi:hypothetical protein